MLPDMKTQGFEACTPRKPGMNFPDVYDLVVLHCGLYLEVEGSSVSRRQMALLNGFVECFFFFGYYYFFLR